MSENPIQIVFHLSSVNSGGEQEEVIKILISNF